VILCNNYPEVKIMANAKSSVNVKIDTDSLDEQIVAAALKRNPKRVSLPTDENGNVIIDKNKHPDIYEWAMNG